MSDEVEEYNPRDRKVTVRLTDDEHDTAKRLSASRGQRLSDLFRDGLVVLQGPAPATTGSAAPRPEAVLLRKSINRVGNNINQAVALMHREGVTDGRVDALLGRLAQLEDEIDRVIR